ncbi:hypothetical protein B0T18DRAFT_422531 [Schizothecium vesticola]|uniref:DUF7703 domain-containing protein n=1 Tax=Schizothecium vesticola TaxID=314040 RepID=A0AA40BQP7_9PEZI|nr:hypothetical protein B0T18DRAFT_422531 [Schizothecium vesticola]
MATNDNGISKDSVPTGWTLVAIIVFISMALYNVVELSFIILATFKRRSGLYFWSFVVAAWGIAPYAVGFLLKALQVMSTTWVYVTLIVIGWCAMVSGQSVVLYSRLHLVMLSDRRLRMILTMIIVDGIICHIPIIVMVYGANSPNPQPYIVPYSVYEKVQVTIFFIQEVIISGCYIYETTRLIRISREVRDRDGTRSLMAHLILVNIFIVMVDITILALEYAGLYDLQTAYKALVYSVKLKLEFSILNRLVELSTRSTNGGLAVHRGNVWMDTLDGGKQKRVVEQGLGNKVQVHSEVSSAKAQGKNIAMTTEISIQRSRRRSEWESDGNSADDRSDIARAASSSSRQGIIEDRYC